MDAAGLLVLFALIWAFLGLAQRAEGQTQQAPFTVVKSGGAYSLHLNYPIDRLSAAAPSIGPGKIGQVWYADSWCVAPGTLDQTCINQAETLASAAGGAVYIPPGTYSISAAVTFLAPTFGAGAAETKLIEISGENMPAPFRIGASDVSLGSLTLDCDSSANTGDGQKYGCLSNFDGLSGYASRDRIMISGVTVKNWYGLNGSTAPCVAIGNEGSDIEVEDSTISACGAAGHAGDGVYISGSHVRIVSNVISSVSDTGAVCEGFSDCTIADNHFVGDVQAYTFSGLLTSVPSSGGTGQGNVIDGGGPALNGAVVSCLNVAPGTADNITFTGDSIRAANDTRGIFVDRCSNVSVANENITALTGTVLQSGLVSESRNVLVTGVNASGNVDGWYTEGCTDCVEIGLNLAGNSDTYGIVEQWGPTAAVSALAHSSGVCTATISAGPPLAAGDYVTVSGATGDTACDGTFKLTAATSTTVTYSAAGSGTPAGSPSLQMEISGGGIYVSTVRGQIDGLYIAGNPQNLAIVGNVLAGNTTPFDNATSGGTFQFSGNTLTRSASVTNLPAASDDPGASIVVSDSTAISTEGQTCTSGGSTAAVAISNGSAWKCF